MSGRISIKASCWILAWAMASVSPRPVEALQNNPSAQPNTEGPSNLRLYPFRSGITGKVGFIDDHGNIKLPAEFSDCGKVDAGRGFREGRAVVGCGLFGYIDSAGRTIIEPHFDAAEPFSEGLAAVKADDLWGYINKDGKNVIPAKFQEAGKMTEGLAAVRDEEGNWGYIDARSHLKIPARFKSAGPFSGGLAPVELDGKFGYIAPGGEFTIPPQFKQARAFSEGLAAVLTDSWSYIRADGKPAFAGHYEQAGDFSGGLAPVKDKRAFGYINRAGEFAIPAQFEFASVFHNDLALVYFGIEKDGKEPKRHILRYGYINKLGNRIFSARLPYAETQDARGNSDHLIDYIPMAQITITSLPSRAKVYMVPLDDWESDQNMAVKRDKLGAYALNRYTPLEKYEVIPQVYHVLLDFDGAKVHRQFDVLERRENYLEVELKKEQ